MKKRAGKTQSHQSNAVADSLPKTQKGWAAAGAFKDNRPEAVAQRALQALADNSPQVQQLRALQDMANTRSQRAQPPLQKAGGVIQLKDIEGAAKALYKKGTITVKWRDIKNDIAKEFDLKQGDVKDVQAALTKLREGKKKPEEEETSDTSQVYQVTRACALQALVRYGKAPFGKSTAEAVHNEIWTNPERAEYKEYDTDAVWKKLYKAQGLKSVAVPKNGKISSLDPGDYIVETIGHVMAVTVDAYGDVTLNQDPGNAIGKAKDKIISAFQ